MPRLDHQVTIQAELSYETRMLLTLLLTEINTLREQAGLSQRTTEQVRQAVRTYIRTHPRT